MTRPQLRRGTRITALVAAMLMMFTTTPAHAHSQLESATPAIDAEMKLAPRSVTLVFNEPVTIAAKGVQLLDTKGKQVAASAAVNGSVVKFNTPKLVAGRYIVRWRVVSADGHVIVASYGFAVATPTKKTKPVSVTMSDSKGRVTATLDGNGPGRRTVRVEIAGSEGVVELKHPSIGAPMLWTMTPSGEVMTASGMIPVAGTWTITARVRVGQFDERVVIGKLTVGS